MDALAQRAPRRSMPVLSRLGVEPLQQGVNFPVDHRIGSCCRVAAISKFRVHCARYRARAIASAARPRTVRRSIIPRASRTRAKSRPRG